MLPILKSKKFPYFLLVVAVIIGFFQWQGKREITKQLGEKSEQLKTIMDNPVIKEITGPVRIVEGKTIVKTIVKEIKVDGTSTETVTETITEPKITEKGATIKEVDYVDPIGLADSKKKRYTVFGQYFMDQTVGLGMTAQFPMGLNLGPNFQYNIEDKKFNVGVVLLIKF